MKMNLNPNTCFNPLTYIFLVIYRIENFWIQPNILFSNKTLAESGSKSQFLILDPVESENFINWFPRDLSCL